MRPTLLLLLASLLTTPAGPRPAVADDFSQFRIPDHHAHSYSFALSGDGNRSSLDRPDYRQRNRRLESFLNAGGRWLRDSDALQWDAGLSGGFNGTRTTQSRAGSLVLPPSMAQDDLRQADTQERATATTSVRVYPARPPLALTLGLTGSLLDDQSWNDFALSQTTPSPGAPTPDLSHSTDSDVRHTYQRSVIASMGAGWGRVRDVSTVQAVWVLEQRWLRDKALSRPLSDGARVRLAQLLSIRPDYAFAHGLPDKAFWADVESIVRDDGALVGEHLGAYAGRHALDPFHAGFRLGNTRLSGFFVGLSFDLQHGHSSLHQDLATSFVSSYQGSVINSNSDRVVLHSASSSDAPLAGCSAEYHRPFGVRTQLDATAFGLTDPRAGRRYSQAGASIIARRWVGERWQLGAEVSQGRVVARQGSGQDNWNTDGEFDLDYFLEDHWSAGLSANVGRNVSDVPSGSGSHDAHFQFSVGYNRGALDAPGLIAPVRSLD